MPSRIFPDRILTSAERSARHHAKHKVKRREYSRFRNMKANYGITKDQFYTMLAIQQNRCLICSRVMQLKGRTSDCVCVDHDHVTNKVRGLLCRNCNTGLGYYSDSGTMHRAAKYLSNHE